MGRLRYAVIALVLVIGAGIAVVVAQGTDPTEVADTPTAEEVLESEPGPPAPALPEEGWLNSEPLAPEDLEGKVVVYDFWTYSCVNCIRTLPYLRAWYERYQDDGLVIIGVHSPEFEFEEDDANVQRAVEENDVTWPVVFDDEMEVWDAFGNQYWPAKYVFDRDGAFRFNHFGEGAYEETEDILRALLDVDPDSPRAEVHPDDQAEESVLDPCQQDQAVAGESGCQTPETYLGALRGGIASSSPEELTTGEGTFTIPDDQVLHTSALSGTWEVTEENIVSVSEGATISMVYEADEVNLVMAPPAREMTAAGEGAAVPVLVELDGEPISESARGEAVVERDGRTYVDVDVDDLYAIVRTDSPEQHTLTLTPQQPGVSAFAFTFGS